MWEDENETMQPKSYLYPPSAPSFNNKPQQPQQTQQIEKSTLPSQSKPIIAPKESSEPISVEAKEKKQEEDVNYLFLAQLVVCLAIVGFVFLMQKTNNQFYVEMGDGYKTALEQGVELTGEHELLKFTEDAVSHVRDAAKQLIGDSQPVQQGAGGWNPTNTQQAPAGFSLGGYTLREAPSLPLEQFTVTSEYGFRKHPITSESDFHGGLDLAAAEGTPIQAVLPGVVLQVGTSNSYGNYVKILHKDNLVSTYSHMQGATVTQGQKIEKGQQVGNVGSTGISTGPHLHLEFLLNGVRVNPALALEISQ